MTWADFRALAPMLWPVVAVLLLMLRRRRSPERGYGGSFVIAVGGLSMGFVQLAWLWQTGSVSDLGAGLLQADPLGLFAGALVFASAGVALVVGVDDLDRRRRRRPEFEVLLLLSVLGALVALQSRNLLVIALGLEIFGICAHTLTGFYRQRVLSLEAATKSLLMGSFGTCLLLFGAALVFGACGSLELADLGEAAVSGTMNSLAVLGVGFVVAGFAIALGAVPFHFWLPDVLQGSPIPVSAYRGVVGLCLGGILFTRLLFELNLGDAENVREFLWWLAAVTLATGSLGALAQNDLRRLLGYLTVAQVGHLLVAVASMRQGANCQTAVEALLVTLLAHAIAVLGAFTALAVMEAELRRPVVREDLAAIGKRHPYLAGAFALFAASLAGLPGTVGFLGRLLEIRAAIETSRQQADESFMLLAILGIVAGVVGLYAALAVSIRFAAPVAADRPGTILVRERPRAAVSVLVAFLLALCVLYGSGMAFLGIGVEPALAWIEKAARLY
ncbi:MAG: proton-conducting transporter membrane subunit [Planctomycetota bacterium]